MIASKDGIEPHSSASWPNSRRVYLPGRMHPSVRVPMREIHLSPSRSMDGSLHPNDPVLVYDPSGP